MRKPGTLGLKKFGPGKALKYESLTNLPTDRSRCLRCLRIKNLKTAQVLKNYVISNPFLPSNVTKEDAHEKIFWINCFQKFKEPTFTWKYETLLILTRCTMGRLHLIYVEKKYFNMTNVAAHIIKSFMRTSEKSRTKYENLRKK